MEEREPYKNDARRAKRRRSLDVPTVCLKCGRAEPEGIRDVGVCFIEGDHPWGRAHESDFKIPLCSSCHREFTAKRRDAGIDLRPIKTDLDREIAVTRANVFHLEEMAKAEKRRLQGLKAHRDKLDQVYPNWREELQNVERG